MSAQPTPLAPPDGVDEALEVVAATNPIQARQVARLQPQFQRYPTPLGKVGDHVEHGVRDAVRAGPDGEPNHAVNRQ